MSETTNFELGAKVVIGGRTMLSPSVSLVGLTGRIVSSRHDAPPGTIAVWVDWDESPYADQEDDLPSTVNVPYQHVEIYDPNRRDEPPSPPLSGKPKLRLT